MLEALLFSQMAKGKKDLVVSVAGHGQFDPYSIEMLLQLDSEIDGVNLRVVSIESEEIQSYLRRFVERYRPEESEKMSVAEKEGRLVFLPFTEKSGDEKYDIIIWPHPSPLGLGHSPRFLARNLREDGLLVLQTDDTEKYRIDDEDGSPFFNYYSNSRDWETLFSRRVSKSDYLFISGQLGFDAVGDVGVFRKR